MRNDKKIEEGFLDDKPIVFASVFKALAVLCIIGAFLAVVAFFSFDWAFSAIVHSRAETTVPDLTKKSADVAIDVLANANLSLRKAGEEYQPEIPSGHIIRQVPPAGTIVREGKVVRVWISQGNENIEVPDVTGILQRNAELLLRQSHLMAGSKLTSSSLTVEKGYVISQKPAAGELAAKGQTVDLVISSGKPLSTQILMPDFRQKQLREANRWASEHNIEINLTEDKHSMFPNSTIIRQYPEPDSEIAPKSSIDITVSARPVSENEKTHRIYYELPQGKNQNRVKIVLIDAIGEREVLNELKQPGSKIDITVPYGGEAKFRIYVDGVLVREKEMK